MLGIACGYEDLNDHDSLRDDALLAVASGRRDVLGERRHRDRDRGHALSGKSTLNRLELSPNTADARARYKKIVYDAQAIDALMVDIFLDAHEEPPAEIVLDLDATDDPIHGMQEGCHPLQVESPQPDERSHHRRLSTVSARGVVTPCREARSPPAGTGGACGPDLPATASGHEVCIVSA